MSRPPWAHGGRPRHRPTWWPEGEPWPPSGPPSPRAWRQFRGRVVGPAVVFFLALFVFTVGGCTLVFWLTVAAVGQLDLPQDLTALALPVVLVALLLGVLALLAAARAVRRAAAPVASLVDAVERVAEGDFEARVSERGTLEGRRLARAFNAMAARLQADEAQRRSLLADVTHELRTPLTVIQGSLEGLLDSVYPADPGHLTPILDETRVLARLIDDLRTLAEAESGTLALRREPTDVGVLCGEALAAFRPRAQAAGVTLVLEVADDLPLLSVDPVRLREVLANLLANALRYTPAGGQVRLGGRALAGDDVIITVSDTGPGISPEALPHIFDRFYKSPDSRGSGLGLAIAKYLVAAHGGEITAASAPESGTTVTICLPEARNRNGL
ncbi:MAG: HAMP domain-containing protein [Anaerolineales bacterium]|nr:HAMP domain-containing protein [Anaerolineales bacterium]